jgi:hypothetical protein
MEMAVNDEHGHKRTFTRFGKSKRKTQYQLAKTSWYDYLADHGGPNLEEPVNDNGKLTFRGKVKEVAYASLSEERPATPTPPSFSAQEIPKITITDTGRSESSRETSYTPSDSIESDQED